MCWCLCLYIDSEFVFTCLHHIRIIAASMRVSPKTFSFDFKWTLRTLLAFLIYSILILKSWALLSTSFCILCSFYLKSLLVCWNNVGCLFGFLYRQNRASWKGWRRITIFRWSLISNGNIWLFQGWLEKIVSSHNLSLSFFFVKRATRLLIFELKRIEWWTFLARIT